MKNRILKCLLLALISLPALAQNRHSVSGYVKDNSNGEGLIGVSVYVREAETGVVTNPYGFYSLTLPDGKYTLVFTYIGYQKVTREVVLDGDKTVTVHPRGRFKADNGVAIAAAAVAGLGIAALPDFLVDAHLKSGALIALMTRYRFPEGGIYVVRAPGQHPARKIRALTELLVERFG